MSRFRRQEPSDQADRLRAAEQASEEISEQGTVTERQLGLVGRLTEGWRRVHEHNHLAKLFRDEGQLG